VGAFSEGLEKLSRHLRKGFLKTETRRAAGKPKQNTRSPQGGGSGPKQCPGEGRDWDGKRDGMAEAARIKRDQMRSKLSLQTKGRLLSGME
jgi:hypothetical protein